jgi:hypothetical protein
MSDRTIDKLAGKVSHTPGPWQVYADTPSIEPNWHIVTNASRMRVLANVHIEPGNEVDAANARLIAAAPELLEACQAIFACIESGMLVRSTANDFDSDWAIRQLPLVRSLAKLNEAIAKAEGR